MTVGLKQSASRFSGTKHFSHSYEWLKDRSSNSREFPESETGTTQVDSRARNPAEDFGLSLTHAETSTEQLPIPDNLNEQLVELFSIADEGLFEDDQSRKFSEKLSALVYIYGDTTIRGLAPFIIGEQASAENAAATLRCLSHLESRMSYNHRIWLMERALQSPSSWIRDAAVLALESMDDPTSIPYLQEAFRKESNAELRQYFHSVLEYLQRKR